MSRFLNLNLLLVFVPVSVVLDLAHGPPLAIFITACLAIIPLAGLMGTATDELAKHLGPTIGGLLNATFGNATELIITLFAIQRGLLEHGVKVSFGSGDLFVRWEGENQPVWMTGPAVTVFDGEIDL